VPEQDVRHVRVEEPLTAPVRERIAHAPILAGGAPECNESARFAHLD
jgi:hypothetical protein